MVIEINAVVYTSYFHTFHVNVLQIHSFNISDTIHKQS